MNYTDITIWASMLIVSLICLIITRNTKFNTLRPALFGGISVLLALASAWASLSIAYMGNYDVGAIVTLSNQSTTTYYYQVIQVVASPSITIICIIILIFTILNIIDIGSNYIQKAGEFELNKSEGKKEKFGDKIRSVGGEIRGGKKESVKGKIKK